jgi:hypothetical protein
MAKELPEHLRDNPEVITDLGSVRVQSGLKSKLGSCNFCCRTDYRIVHELSGNRTSVRLCNSCLKLVQKYKVQPNEKI